MLESDGGRRVKTVVTTDILRAQPTDKTPVSTTTAVPSLQMPDETTTTEEPIVDSTEPVVDVPFMPMTSSPTLMTEHSTSMVTNPGQADLKEFVERVHASQIGLWVVIALLLVGCLGAGGVAFYCHKQHVS
jgi:hypothetical protein